MLLIFPPAFLNNFVCISLQPIASKFGIGQPNGQKLQRGYTETTRKRRMAGHWVVAASGRRVEPIAKQYNAHMCSSQYRFPQMSILSYLVLAHAELKRPHRTTHYAQISLDFCTHA